MRLLISIILATSLCIPLGVAVRFYVLVPYQVIKCVQRRPKKVKCRRAKPWKEWTPKQETVIDWRLI